MSRGTKLGVASLVAAALAIWFVSTGRAEMPAVVFAVLAIVLGGVAASNSSKWWLTVPTVIIVVFGFLIYVGAHAY